MKVIKVLGSGCTKCIKTADLIKRVAGEMGAQVDVVKETNPEAIMNFGVMSTPAVVIDDTVMHSGSIPDQNKIKAWLESSVQ